jgi:hypothetical protein
MFRRCSSTWPENRGTLIIRLREILANLPRSESEHLRRIDKATEPTMNSLRDSPWILSGWAIEQLLIVKHALYDGEIRLAQDTVDELIQKLKAI